MILLPKIEEYITARPGNYTGSQSRMIPDSKQESFWNDFYGRIASGKQIQTPIRNFNPECINPFFGYFGEIFHPSKQKPYFHVGIDITGNTKNVVFPISDAILEYSGFGVINGNYVLLRHNEIQTEDGYVLFSMYAHLKKYLVTFTGYQKMLREISLRTYPEIIVPKDTPIGKIGDSGNPEEGNFHLHLQLEFRKEKKTPIVIDPLRVFGLTNQKNKTAQIKNKREFSELGKKYQEELKEHNLLMYWEKGR